MKKPVAWILMACILLALFAGCSQPEREAAPVVTEQTEPAANLVRTVHDVDELVAAIAPGAVIRLADGTYNLSASQSYGNRTGNPYVKWEDCWDGFQLLIHDVDDLTILGSGYTVTSLITQPRNANVLAIEDCTNVTLEGFTAGHAEQAQVCSGNVIYVERSEGVRMNGLYLYGCGAVGVQAMQSSKISMNDCVICDCSSSGIQLFGCREVAVTGCPMYGIGKTIDGWNQGYTVFGMESCEGVEVSQCAIRENDTQYLLVASQCLDVRFRENEITNNAASNSMFILSGSQVTMETSNVLKDNSFGRWYDKSWDTGKVERAVDESGAEAYAEDPEPIHQTSEPAVSKPVITGGQKQVRAATVEAFLAAIDSNTEIILTGESYDLSTAADYGTSGGSHYTWEETYDGCQLIIHDVENFSIISEDDCPEKHTMSAVPRYANVLVFRNCKNGMVRGFTAGHTVVPGSCLGGVLYYDGCSEMLVENCSLYGCGILGVTAQRCAGMQVINSKIYECSYGGILCMESRDVTIGGCEFWDLGGDTFQIADCSGVVIDGREISSDYYGN